ncbi:MAG TPA: S8 family peptidase [Nitrospiraceae bacterium]|nr:S8 family peptidase [Nitrospiraceae bacterium]
MAEKRQKEGKRSPKKRAQKSRSQAVDSGPPMGRATVPPALNDPKQRLEWKLPKSKTKPGPYMVELNLFYKGGLQEASRQFGELYTRVLGEKANARPPVPVSKTYYRCMMSVDEWRQLVKQDEEDQEETGKVNAKERRDRVIYRIWPDFPVKALIDRSVATVKADAAFRSYEATGSGIVWAVIDSGIDQHLHFGHEEKNAAFNTLLHDDVRELHRDFTGDGKPTKESAGSALTDRFGHGTHVAGIIAGGLGEKLEPGKDFVAYEKVFESTPSGEKVGEKFVERPSSATPRFRGVAPKCKLISLKVLDDDGNGRASNIMLALEYIREELNHDPKIARVHGVNLSIGYEFDPEMFACGQSPLCVEVDRMVKSGVVVVVAAGNTGYGRVNALQRQTKVGISNTINDPGNAALAITVGATHREFPHTYGVSYFSSKGPTGDGRLKPDLVAPGERITSCAAGKKLEIINNSGEAPDDRPAYVDDTGTSMAAPHVSGAIAAFLSIRREFIQRPEEVKKIFLESATPLGRERYFEGHGLLDLMRAIQSV